MTKDSNFSNVGLDCPILITEIKALKVNARPYTMYLDGGTSVHETIVNELNGQTVGELFHKALVSDQL